MLQSGFHFLIFCLKDFRLSKFLIVSRAGVHIFGAIYTYGLCTMFYRIEISALKYVSFSMIIRDSLIYFKDVTHNAKRSIV